MDTETYSTLYRDAREALLQRKVADALACIKAMLYLDNPAPDTTELDNLQTNYRLLLDFMSHGGNDPQRQEIHSHIVLRAFMLLEQAYRSSLLKYGNGMIAPLLKQMQNDPLRNQPAALVAEASARLAEIAQFASHNMQDTEKGTALESKREEWHIRLFNALATEEFLHPDETQALAEGLELLPVTAGELALSALFLSLWTCFDANKAVVLLQLCESEIPELRVRALTGLVWTCIGHSRQLALHEDVLKGISLLKNNPTVRHELTLIQKQWYISLETVRADKKMKEEILPDLVRSKQFQRTRMGFEEVDADLMDALNGKSDGQSQKEEERLARNMQEFMKMNEEGIDINLGTFSSLKKTPFFGLPANWFWPFDEYRRDVRQLFLDNKGTLMRSLNALLKYSGYCNSDSYSLCLILQQVPQQQRELIFTQIAGKMEENGHTIEEIGLRGPLPPVRLYKQYFEDMYRFFKLHPQRKEFTDVFSLDPLFSNYPPLKELVWDTEYIREMGNFLMKLGYYKDAAAYWEEYIKKECVTAEVLCKLGYCHQKSNQPEKALLHYQQADLLEPDSKWLYNQLRLCYADLNLPDRELECLLKLESMEPDNVKVLQETGLCMMQAKRYEEAANRFYKLEFMGEKVWAASRAIAWCLLKQHKTAQAEKYYARIIGNGKARWEDYLNAGHTAWILGKTEDAVAFYRKYIELYNGRKESGNALIPFYNDRKELQEWGIEEIDIDLMGDIISMEH